MWEGGIPPQMVCTLIWVGKYVVAHMCDCGGGYLTALERTHDPWGTVRLPRDEQRHNSPVPRKSIYILGPNHA